MPTITVPTAPIPPHTAYAVPIGMVRELYSSNAMLIVTDTRKASVQGRLRNVSTWRSEVVKPTSKSPPTISQNHAINRLLGSCFGFQRNVGATDGTRGNNATGDDQRGPGEREQGHALAER